MRRISLIVLNINVLMLDKDTHALFRVTLLGIVVGLFAALTVLAFRLAIDVGQELFLPNGQSGNFEALAELDRFLLPIGGAIVLAIFFSAIPAHMRLVGVTHVIDFLRFRKEKLPMSNAIVQFVGAVVAIITGHSVDREGPSIHIGAANAGFVTHHAALSIDDQYLLTAAGGAAAIAAAYNTPLAAVIFVIEVFRVRYALNRIVPIIVATVTGTVLGALLVDDYEIQQHAQIQFGSHTELPFIVAIGIAIGVVANIFIRGIKLLRETSAHWSPFVSFTLAGIVTGSLAVFAPEIMGVSYDTINRLLSEDLIATPLWLLFFAKLTATISAIGFGIPGGLIGPSLFIGGALGSLAEYYAPGLGAGGSGAGFYTLLGMVAMMGAVLRAPLAALVALIELSSNIHLILPGMVIVVVAELVTRAGIGDRSAFTVMLAVKNQEQTTASEKS